MTNLKYLAQVKRFESQLMFLSSEDQKSKFIYICQNYILFSFYITLFLDIGELFKHLNDIKTDANEIEKLKKIFKL